MKCWLSVAVLVVCCFRSGDASAAGNEPYEAIDRHALGTPDRFEKTLPDLARYLINPAKNDTEKVRSFSRWIADRISYDDELKEKALKAYASGNFPPEFLQAVEAPNVLRTRKTVCEGYSNLFVSLCKKAEVEAVRIDGNQRDGKLSHSWNAVRLDGKWQLLDLTRMSARSSTGKSFNQFFFLPAPDEMIFFDLPNKPRWQLLGTPVSKAEFYSTSEVNYLLFQFGVTGRELREKLDTKGVAGFVSVGNLNGHVIKIIKAPLDRRLKVGARYTFQIQSDDFSEIAVSNRDQYKVFNQEHDMFEIEIVAQAGDLTVGGKVNDGRKPAFRGMLQYVVE